MPGKTADNMGYDTGAALCGVFQVQASIQPRSAMQVAKFFAQAAGYRDIDAAMEFINGFLAALDEVGQAVKRVDAPKDPLDFGSGHSG